MTGPEPDPADVPDDRCEDCPDFSEAELEIADRSIREFYEGKARGEVTGPGRGQFEYTCMENRRDPQGP